MERVYSGRHNGNGAEAFVDGAPLEFPDFGTSFQPREYAWGFEGVGSKALAFAILSHYLGDVHEAFCLHREFMVQVVARLPAREWTLTAADIDASLAQLSSDGGPVAPGSPELSSDLL